MRRTRGTERRGSCVRLGWQLAVLGAAVVAPPASARADNPYQLQASAYGRAESGVALLSVSGEGQADEWLSAEALVWAGTQADLSDPTGDAVVMVVRLRDPGHRGELRLGRFIAHMGALRPLHLDGISGRLRLPLGLVVEAYGGIQVAPELGAGAYDWAVGTRLSRPLGDWGSLGVAYGQRRVHGVLSDQEIGIDGGFALGSRVDASGRVAYDLIDPGLSEAQGALLFRSRSLRAEVFGSYRSPSRILPATSLFTVFGDQTSTRLGSRGFVRMAPRLDISGTAAVRLVGESFGESLTVRSALRLDREGHGEVALELRREGGRDVGWTGIRGTARMSIVEVLSVVAEAELVVPDDGQGRGVAWPWGLLGFTFEPAQGWEMASAVEASSTPDVSRRLDLVVRLTHRREGML